VRGGPKSRGTESGIWWIKQRRKAIRACA